MRDLTKEQIEQVAGGTAVSSYGVHDPSMHHHGKHHHGKKHDGKHHDSHNTHDPYGHVTYDPYSVPPPAIY